MKTRISHFLQKETYFKLLNLAFLVVLELVHVALKLLDILLCLLLTLLSIRESILEPRNALLRTFDICLELRAMSATIP